MKTKKYDVAIIGSGLGGLAAAGHLTQSGYQMLLVARLPFLGGRCANTHFQ